MNEKKSSGAIVSGVKCDCVNCRFHSTDSRCHAGSIAVGYADAVKKGETVCETFSNCCAE